VIARLPGTYAPQDDTALLISTLRESGLACGRRVLDICTGTGAVAVAAAAAGAASVTAVDLSRRAVASARLNSMLARAEIDVRCGDLFAPVAGRTFDLVVANPPYVPAATEKLPRHRNGRSWDGGCDGRALVDRICRGARDVLSTGGMVLMTHTAVIDADHTLGLLAEQGFEARVVARRALAFGPVMRARADLLAARGLIGFDQRVEEIVVVEATLPALNAVVGLPQKATAGDTDSRTASQDRLAG
jgi:release factor glutamine methyltransferase